MPDSLPHIGWGPAPFDERDLDALLSGHMADIPPALHQVADALIALHAPPTRAELSGEAAIMAEFSTLAESGAFRPGEAAQAGAYGQAHTLVLPVPPPGGTRGHRARHRGHRARRPVSWRAGALMGTAAAAVILIAAVFSGSLRGPMDRLTHLTTSSPTATNHTIGGSPSQGVAAKSAAPERTASHRPASRLAHAATQTPQSQASTLCRSWAADFAHAPHSRWDAELSLFWQISKLAGGPYNVFKYCAPYVQDMFPHGFPTFFPGGRNPHGHGRKADPGPGGVGPNGKQGSQGQSLTDPGSASGNEKAASSNGQQ